MWSMQLDKAKWMQKETDVNQLNSYFVSSSQPYLIKGLLLLLYKSLLTKNVSGKAMTFSLQGLQCWGFAKLSSLQDAK